MLAPSLGGARPPGMPPRRTASHRHWPRGCEGTAGRCNVAATLPSRSPLNVTATLHPRGEAGNPGERRRDASVCHRGPASPALTLLGTPLRRAGPPPEDSRMYRPPAACIEPVTPEASCQASHREPGSRAVLSIQRARWVGRRPHRRYKNGACGRPGRARGSLVGCPGQTRAICVNHPCALRRPGSPPEPREGGVRTVGLRLGQHCFYISSVRVAGIWTAK